MQPDVLWFAVEVLRRHLYCHLKLASTRRRMGIGQNPSDHAIAASSRVSRQYRDGSKMPRVRSRIFRPRTCRHVYKPSSRLAEAADATECFTIFSSRTPKALVTYAPGAILRALPIFHVERTRMGTFCRLPSFPNGFGAGTSTERQSYRATLFTCVPWGPHGHARHALLARETLPDVPLGVLRGRA